MPNHLRSLPPSGLRRGLLQIVLFCVSVVVGAMLFAALSAPSFPAHGSRTVSPNASLVAVTASPKVPSHSTAWSRHYLARRSAKRHHAARVHNAALRRARARRLALLRNPYGIDGISTNTPHWLCIRLHEEGMQAAPGNMFGFVPFYYPMSDAAQRALALSILHRFGWGAWSTAPGCGV